METLSRRDAQMRGQYLLSSLISMGAGNWSGFPHLLHPFSWRSKQDIKLFLDTQSVSAPQPSLLTEVSLKDGSVTCKAAPEPQHFINLRREVSQSQCPLINSLRQVSSYFLGSKDILTVAQAILTHHSPIFSGSSSQQEKSWLLELFQLPTHQYVRHPQGSRNVLTEKLVQGSLEMASQESWLARARTSKSSTQD